MNKLYAAPMEGLTGYLWRQVHAALFGPAQHRFDVLHHNRHGKGLGNVIICQGVKTLHLAGVIVQGGDHDDGNPALFPQNFAHGKAVNFRKH